MKIYAFLALSLTVSTAFSQPAAPRPVDLMQGLSTLHHPVSTTNPEAQQFFDQGLRLVYAFNHDEAARSFHRAADLDPQLAMAWWGVALAVGPNYNLPVDPDHEKLAIEAIDKAKSLSPGGPQIEKDYIEALARRYSHDAQPNYQQLNVDYSNAMRRLNARFPYDLYAATLFADSMMNLRPWKLYRADGTPEQGTDEIVATLESVLRRDPSHIGAMHLYIHAVEASSHPERALPYADRIAALAPSAGHLVHMPAHIYERTGNYDGARQHNVDAAKADEDYAAATGMRGIYSMMYYSHNLHFGAIAASMQGRCAEAQAAANHLADNVRPALKEMPMLEAFASVALEVSVRCARWDDLLAAPEPDAQDSVLKAFSLYSRGMALVARGKTVEAETLMLQLSGIEAHTPRDQFFMLPIENHTWQIFHIADDILAARIAAARGDKPAAIDLLRDAVASQDKLLYD